MGDEDDEDEEEDEEVEEQEEGHEDVPALQYWTSPRHWFGKGKGKEKGDEEYGTSL
jgi:hypothetical protein